MGQIQTWWSELPDDTLVETAWERQMNLTGSLSYERSRTDKNGKPRAATESVAGQKFLRKLLERAEEGIETMQKSIVTNARVDRNHRGTVIAVPAETCALLTLKPIIDRTYFASNPEFGVPLQGVVTTVAKAVELELNFRHWVEKSKEAAKAYAKAEGLASVPRSRAERLIQEHGVSRQSLIRWRNTFEELSEYKWNTLEQHYCGDALVSAVVTALPEFFEIQLMRNGVLTPKTVRMTDTFREDFNNLEFQVSSAQLSKKPMITKPRRWEKT